MHLFISHFSKRARREFPKWFNHACDRGMRLKRPTFRRWRRSPTPVSDHRFGQARNKCSAIIQRPKERFVDCKAKHVSPVTVAERLGSLRRPSSAVSALPICNSSGDLVCEPYGNGEVFVSRFASISVLLRFPTSPASFPIVLIFLLRISTRKVHQALRSLTVSKPPGPNGIPPIVSSLCH